VRVLESPRELARLRDGKVPVRQPEVVERPARDFSGATAWDRGEQIREAFLNPPNAVVTKTLLFANVLVFLVGLYFATRVNVPANLWLYGSGDDAWQNKRIGEIQNQTGAVTAADLVAGKWWRLLTCCFVHLGLLHLGVNMWGVYMIGRFL